MINPSKIANELEIFQDYWTVIYGSYVNGEYIPSRSDIDIAIITRTEERQKNLEIWRSLLDIIPNNYDIKIFELLPLYIKIDIIQTFKVLFGNPLEISEYFYKYLKIWKDMSKRVKTNQFNNVQEKIDSIERRKRIIG